MITYVRLGQWSSVEEAIFDLTLQQREDLSKFGIQKVYKVVVVQQPPFVFWNKTKGPLLSSQVL